MRTLILISVFCFQLSAFAQGFWTPRIGGTNLVVRISMDSPSSTKDLSGNGNDAFLNNAYLTNGVIGGGLYFTNISTSYLSNSGAMYSIPTNSTDRWTLSAWVFLYDTSSAILWGFGNTGGLASGRTLIQFNSHIYFWAISSDLDSGVNFDLNQWQLITITYDGVSVRIYKNSSLVYGPVVKALSNATASINVGRGFATSSFQIDDARIYRTDLSAGQVSDLYNGGRGTQQ